MADISQIRLPSGDTFDLIDEKSGYITAQYIENKTDYSIPVSRAGEIIAGETAIGTNSTNFPTSKAVVDYVDERVVQEMDAIDVGVTGIKANGTSLTVENGVVNIPVVGPNQSVGLMTSEYMTDIYNYIHNVSDSIPTSTSQLTNDSGFITSETDPTVPAWAKASTKPTYTANEVGALPSDTVITDEKLKVDLISGSTIGYLIVGGGSTAKTQYYTNNISVSGNNSACLTLGNTQSQGKLFFHNKNTYGVFVQNGTLTSNRTIVLPDADGTIALTTDIPTVPTNISSFTNDSGYLTASDIASVMTYKGTKANYAALPASGNTTGDVWHLTDTGAEWAWDGSAWQELGTAIDLSGYVESSRTADSTTTVFLNSGIGGSIQSTYQGTDNESYIQTAADDSSASIELYASDGTNSNQMIISPIETFISGIITPVDDTDAANKKYVDDSIGALSIPTKVSDLTNDSGFISSYTETDPVFSASAAAGITATDISNWNAKVSDDGTWNGVSLTKSQSSGGAAGYVPYVTSTSATSANYYPVSSSSTYTANAIPKYTSSGYLYAYTPSANDNSTKVATTAYVDAAIPDVSRFIPTTTNTTTINATDGFRLYQYDNTSTGGFRRLSLGNEINYKTSGGAYGVIRFYDSGQYYHGDLLPNLNLTGDQTWTLPNATGTIALTSDIPDVSGFVSDDKTWNGVTLNQDTQQLTTYYVPTFSNFNSTSAKMTYVTSTPSNNKIVKWDSNSYLYSTTPSANDNSTKVATTAYVNAAIPKVYSSINTGGYLTMATLPIYDGTVV